jgi:hypothetical protein
MNESRIVIILISFAYISPLVSLLQSPYQSEPHPVALLVLPEPQEVFMFLLTSLTPFDRRDLRSVLTQYIKQDLQVPPTTLPVDLTALINFSSSPLVKGLEGLMER